MVWKLRPSPIANAVPSRVGANRIGEQHRVRLLGECADVELGPVGRIDQREVAGGRRRDDERERTSGGDAADGRSLLDRHHDRFVAVDADERDLGRADERQPVAAGKTSSTRPVPRIVAISSPSSSTTCTAPLTRLTRATASQVVAPPASLSRPPRIAIAAAATASAVTMTAAPATIARRTA